MKFNLLIASGVASLCLGLAGSANAQFTTVPVPTNAYITFNGYDWAWAHPVQASGQPFWTPVDLSFQGTQGWRIPTAQELLLAPLAINFLVPGGNVPFNGIDPITGANVQLTNGAYSSAQSAAAIATPYFSDTFDHVDWSDGQGQGGVWAGLPGSAAASEQLLIRGSGQSAAAPEPGTLALLALGALGFLARRNHRAR